jgi:iron-sulfur cluster assembly accessory protein
VKWARDVSRISLSKRAGEVLAQIRAEVAPPESYLLRIRVVGGGCAGFVYDLYFDQLRDGDERVAIDGTEVLVDELSRLYAAELEIGYADSDEPGFVFKNARAGAICACGASFRP